MTKRFPGLTAAALTLVAAPALAGQPGADWMPMDQVLRKLADAGYGAFQKIEADDGQWEGKATKDGKVVSFIVDPKSGAVTEKVKGEKAGKDGDRDD
jgi:hypothetical protein